MKKMAIFVEGQTERMFTERLLIEVGGRHRLRVESWSLFGGRRFTRTVKEFHLISAPEPQAEKFYVLIIDSGTEGRITSDINDRYETLVGQGHTAIIGVRDVAPNFTYEQRPKLIKAFEREIKNSVVVPVLILATMEVEAWFMGEPKHFLEIDRSLTPERISKDLHIDLLQHDLERRERPAEDLAAIYALAGLSWSKTREEIERTVQALDIAEMYVSGSPRTPSLKPLVAVIDKFLSS